MVSIRPSRSPAELLAKLDALEDERDEGTFDIDDLSNFRMLERLNTRFHVVHARFTGDLPEAHAIGVREAATILGSFQEVLSEVGAVLLDDAPRRGPLPQRVLQATALRFSPEVQAGSVVFAMRPPRDNSLLVASSTTLDDAMSAVFALFDRVERPVSAGGTPDTIVGTLRRFGPRTARHLVNFAAALGTNGLSLDIGVAKSGKRPHTTRLSTSGASYLRTLAEKATTRTDPVELVGDVHNLGKDHKHKIDDDERGRITLTATSDVTDVLQSAFRQHRVRIAATETEVINVATGKITSTFEAVSAEAISE